MYETANDDHAGSGYGSRAKEVSVAADVILHNARIATNRVPSFVEAVAIEGGKFVAAGASDEILRQRGPATLVIDAGGRTVIPGLNDSHLHLIRGGLNYNLELRWDGVPSLADALRMLREQAARTPPPQWVRVVGGWTEFQFAERRMPTLDEINAVEPGHAGVRPPPLRPGAPQPGGPPGGRLHPKTRPTRPAGKSSGTRVATRPVCSSPGRTPASSTPRWRRGRSCRPRTRRTRRGTSCAS